MVREWWMWFWRWAVALGMSAIAVGFLVLQVIPNVPQTPDAMAAVSLGSLAVSAAFGVLALGLEYLGIFAVMVMAPVLVASEIVAWQARASERLRAQDQLYTRIETEVGGNTGGRRA